MVKEESKTEREVTLSGQLNKIKNDSFDKRMIEQIKNKINMYTPIANF